MDEVRKPADPLVSVILPVFNGAEFLAEAIRSVQAQDYHPIELMVVDDGSTDATSRIAADFGNEICYFVIPHAGPAAARNFGIRHAKGEFITFLDADDLWPEHKLRRQMECFRANPETDIVQGLVRRFGNHNPDGQTVSDATPTFPFLYSNLGSMVMRRSVFDRIGYLEESLPYHEDTDLWLRAREAGLQILVERRIGLLYRIHSRNITRGEDIRTMGFLNILRRSIDRRRRQFGSVHPVGRLPFVPDRPARTGNDETQAGGENRPDPLLSVVLWVGADPSGAEAALDSIHLQEYRPVELLIAGPAPVSLRERIGGLFERVVWIEQESSDPAAQLDEAVGMCRGELVAFLDSGGQWAREKTRIEVDCLREHPELGFVVGRTRHIIDPGTKYSSELFDGLAVRKSLGDLLGTLMARRAALEQVGGFESGLPGMEETDWFLRASDRLIVNRMLPDVLLYRFVQPSARVVGADVMKAALLQSVRASVHRKRERARQHG